LWYQLRQPEKGEGKTSMPVNLSTTVKKIDWISNKENQLLVRNYHEFMKSCEVSERHINNNLKVMLSFANYLDSDSENQVKFSDIKSSEIIFINCMRITRDLYTLRINIWKYSFPD
jgi:hypothetical protein